MEKKERFYHARKAAGLSQKQAGIMVGVSQQTIADIENGEIANPKNILAYAKAYGVTPEYLEYGEHSIAIKIDKNGNTDKFVNLPLEITYIPVISWSLAGRHDFKSGGIAKDNDEILDYVSVYGKASPNSYGLEIKGDVMLSFNGGKRSFHGGDVIIVESGLEPRPGDIVIVYGKDWKEADLREYSIEGGIEYLLPLKEHYPIQRLDDGFEIKGIVTSSVIRLRQEK